MSYLSVISLEDAKTYLGVDDTSRDAEISRFIKSALSYLEKVTNVHVIAKDKTYQYDSTDCVYVYDYPINSTTNTTATAEIKTLYSIYTESDSSIDSITLNIGYTNVVEIDPDWIECGYVLIECLYEGGKLAALPDLIKIMISTLKRFVV